MLSLPDVLVQSTMHSLRAPDIIRLARCSRRLLGCADNAFAWLHCLLVRIRYPAASAGLVPPPVCRLLPRIPVRLWWACKSPARTYRDRVLSLPAGHLQRLLTLNAARVVELQIEIPGLLSVSDERMFFAPDCWQLVRFISWLHPSVSILRCIALLPRLTQLDLGDSVADYTPLLSAAALTSLIVRSRSARVRGPSADKLLRILELPIRTLFVPLLRLSGSDFVSFCTAPSMAQLRELTLGTWVIAGFPWEAISASYLEVGFAALKSLHTLRLFDTSTELGPVFAHLHLLPALTLLSLDRHPWPLDHCIVPLLQRAPGLRVELSPDDASDAAVRAAVGLDLSIPDVQQRVESMRLQAPEAADRIVLLSARPNRGAHLCDFAVTL